MGRTRRKRKKRQIIKKNNELKKLINLQKTLRLKGPHVEINYFEDTGWGLRCKKRINKGEVIIALPLKFLITTDVKCEIFSALRIENEPHQFILSIFLIYESHLGRSSKYIEYIESLPQFFTNPYFCTKEEVNLLPTFIKKEISTQTFLIESFLEKIHKITKDKSCPHCEKSIEDIFTSEKFIWAWFIVNTRSVYYEDEKCTKSLALAPFLDLFNHSNDAVTEMFIDFKSRLYILKTLIAYKKFEQVFIKYGAHSNLKLFVEYGFILPENPHDFVEFSFEEILESAREFDFSIGEISKLKYNCIKSNKLNQNLTKMVEFSWNFIGLIYVLATKDHNLSLLQSKIYSNLFTASEMNAIKRISEIASEKKFRKLKTDLDKMEKIRICTGSFQVAKNLTKIYMNLLQ